MVYIGPDLLVDAGYVDVPVCNGFLREVLLGRTKDPIACRPLQVTVDSGDVLDSSSSMMSEEPTLAPEATDSTRKFAVHAENIENESVDYILPRKRSSNRKRKLMDGLTRSGASKRKSNIIEDVEYESGTTDEDEVAKALKKAYLKHIKDNNLANELTLLLNIDSLASILNKEVGDAHTRARVFNAVVDKSGPDISIPHRAECLGTPVSSFKRYIKTCARDQHPQDPPQPPRHVGRPALPHLEDVRPEGPQQQAAYDWVLPQAPVTSGHRNHRCMKYGSYAEAHKAYSSAVPNAFSVDHFTKLMEQWGVHHLNFDKYQCPDCSQGEPSREHRELLESQFKSYDLHKKLVLDGKAAIMVMDFCRVHEIGEVSVATNNGKSKTRMKMSCLAVVLVTQDPAEKTRLLYQNFDFTSVSTQSGEFVYEALAKFKDVLLPTLQFTWNMIYVWADGGMANGPNLGALANLQFAIADLATAFGETSFPLLQSNYFPPYHGHNVCDAHFGRIKESVRRHAQTLPDRHSVINAANSLPHTQAFELQDAIIHVEPKTKAQQASLNAKDAQQYVGSVKLKEYRAVLFDVYSEHPFLLYKSSDDIVPKLPIRVHIIQNCVPLPAKKPFLGENPPKPWEQAKRDLPKVTQPM